ncbi:MAG: hypothetical protein GY711_04980 [bacterium]|nr:hypothetical protein [bacterium]
MQTQHNSSLFTLAVVLLAFSSACATRPRVSAMPRIGDVELDGDVIAEPAGPVSGRASADSLGLDEDEGVFLPRADLDWDRMHVTVQGYSAEFSGEGVADATLDLGDGNPITVGAAVRSDADLTLLTGSVTYDFFPGLPFELGLGAGLGLIDYDVRIAAIAGPGAIETDDDLPFGFLTLRLARAFGDFELVGIASGVGVEFDDDDVDYFDADVSLGWRVVERSLDLQLMGGYRFQTLDYEFSNNGGRSGVDIDLDGPYVGLVLSF